MVFYKLFHSQQCLADKSKAGVAYQRALIKSDFSTFLLLEKYDMSSRMYYLTDINLEEVVLSTDDGIYFMWDSLE